MFFNFCNLNSCSDLLKKLFECFNTGSCPNA